MLYKQVSDGTKTKFIAHTDKSEWPDKASCMARIAELHKAMKNDLGLRCPLYPTDLQRRKWWLRFSSQG
jgi:hypothetical protein